MSSSVFINWEDILLILRYDEYSFRQIGPLVNSCGKLAPLKILVQQIGPQKIFRRQIGPWQMVPQQVIPGK